MFQSQLLIWLRSMDKVTSKYLFCLICLTSFTGVCGDAIVEIDDYSQSKAITSCKKGLIAYVDNYTITARITSKLNTLQSREVVTFQIYIQNGTFEYSLCQFNFSESCKNMRASRGCYLKQEYNGTFEIMLNKKAELEESEGDIFLKWPTFGSTSQLETRTVQLPVIYQQEQENLYVGTRQVSVDSYCTAYFDPGDVLRWCVKNLLRHTLTISFNYGQFHSSNQCVKHKFKIDQATSQSFTISYEEHEGCQRRKVYTCNWHANLKPEGFQLSFTMCVFYCAVILGCVIRYVGHKIVEYIGFTRNGIKKRSLASIIKKVVLINNDFGQRLLSTLQRVGHKGQFDFSLCAQCALIGGGVGMGLWMNITTIRFVGYGAYTACSYIEDIIWENIIDSYLRK